MTCGMSVLDEDSIVGSYFLSSLQSLCAHTTPNKLGTLNERSSEHSLTRHEVAKSFPLGVPTRFSHKRHGAILPVSGIQGSWYMFRLVCLWGTPPKLGVALDEASIEGVPTCELDLLWLKTFSNINNNVAIQFNIYDGLLSKPKVRANTGRRVVVK